MQQTEYHLNKMERKKNFDLRKKVRKEVLPPIHFRTQ